MDNSRKQVLIAGAGPVGLTAALALAQRGVSSLVLEKRGELSRASKASTFHSPTLEIFKEFSMLDAMLDQGELVESIQYRFTTSEVFAEFRHRTLEEVTSCPFRLHLEQSAITPMLLERMRASGLSDIRFDTEVIDAGSDGDSAWLKVRNAGGDIEVLQADYALGADGAHSPVRKALGIGFDSTPYPGRVLRVIVENEIEGYLPGIAPVAYLFATPARSISLLKMPSCWRIIIRVPAGTADETALSPEWYLPVVAEFIPGLEKDIRLKGCDVYSASKAVAEEFGKGRVFLIGDATHLTNTRGGMNMNCGIHDAYAMADAIARALGDGSPHLVEAASAQRRSVAAEQLIPRTDRNVSGKASWLDTIRETAADSKRALDYLTGTAMLDIAPPRRSASNPMQKAI